ncbi:MAG: DUF4442 domain-containing protein [Gammaproteobacteria bacterium]|nr:DUF4442 domain-containing protein [Gammaproteobacteria bacterium]
MSIWQRTAATPAGKWLFSKLVCRKAPYFATIKPLFVDLKPGLCEVRMRKRHAVQNHIGTVHAIAMCNLAELAGGTMTDVTVPASHRWIPKGMSVEYVKKAETDLRGVARVAIPEQWADAQELPVPVEVFDAQDQLVFRAVIAMWVTRKPANAR